MSWDFETPADVQERLDWADEFVRTEVEPLDLLISEPRDRCNALRQELIPPLQQIVKARGLWACHLKAADGGSGVGFVESTLLNEILGRTNCGPTVFGCQSPDAGNAEILAAFGTAEQKAQYLTPLVAGEVVSAFAATEPQGGSDPTTFQLSADLDDGEWVLNGEKWFITGAGVADFFIVMAVTDPDRPRHERMSLLLVPKQPPGLTVIRHIHVVGKDGGEDHSYLEFRGVRVPGAALLGPRGGAFKVMQARMGVARLLLAMRALGQVKQALDMMCERALSRHAQGSSLADKQLVQSMIAESWMELAQFRLLVLQTAWKLERVGNSKAVRTDIAAVKSLTARVIKNVALRAIQLHGSIGVSGEVPFMDMLGNGLTIGVADGSTEVHDIMLAKDILKNFRPADGIFPSRHTPAMRRAAEERYAGVLERVRTR